MQGFDEAQRYLDSSTELREALAIAPDARLVAQPLAQGEHNANFWFLHPGTGKKVVLRLNYASQLGLADQVSYEFAALRTLEPSGRTPKPLFVDDSKRLLDRGVLAMEFCEGDLLDYEREGDVDFAALALADIHAVAPAGGCRLFRPKDPLGEQFRECVRMFDVYRCWAHAEQRVIETVDGLLRRAQVALDKTPAAVDTNHVLNTEAIAAHFLIEHGASDVRVVDWEKPILGEVAQDVAYFLSPTTTIWDVDYIFTDEQRHAFVDAYWRAVDGRFSREGFDQRFPAYVMTNCLRGITWSASALVEYADPNRPLKNEKTAAVLGRYVSADFLDMVKRRFF